MLGSVTGNVKYCVLVYVALRSSVLSLYVSLVELLHCYRVKHLKHSC